MARWCFLPLLLALVFRLPCAAAAPDPAALLAQFEALGFPDLRGARYVALDTWNPLEAGGLFGYEMKSGNAWILSETGWTKSDSPRARLVINGACDVTVGVDPAARPRAVDLNRPAVSGWEPADTSQDVHRAVWMLDALAAGKLDEPYDWDKNRPRLFLFALALQQRGDEASARRLLAGLFASEEEAGVLEAQAKNLLADQLYHSLFYRFAQTGDWTAYRDGMKSLLPRFPSGRKERGAVEKVLALVEDAIRGEAPLSEGLSDAEKKLAADLLKADHLAKTGKWSPQTVLWLIPDSWTARIPPEGDPDLRIRALGPAAIPLLTALVGDGAFTRIPLKRGQFDTMDLRKDSLLMSSLPRPMTRGEAALAILRDILPRNLVKGAHSYEAPETESLLQAAGPFYEDIKTRSDEEIAGMFLRDTSYESARKPALDFLLSRAPAGPVPILEKHLLFGSGKPPEYAYEPDSLARIPDLVRYVAIRGAPAVPLAGQMAERLEKDAVTYRKPENVSFGSPEGDEKQARETKDKLRKAAAGLRAVPWDWSTDRLLQVRLESAGDTGLTNTLLVDRLQAMPPTKAYEYLLARAAKETNAEARMRFTGLVAMVAAGRPASTLGSPVDHADLWRVLFADAREKEGRQVRDVFVVLQEQLFGDRPADPASNPELGDMEGPAEGPYHRFIKPTAVRAIIERYGEEGRAAALKRALARLDGVPEAKLPAIPSAADVNDAGAKSVAGRLAPVGSREEAEACVRAMSLAEREMLARVLTNEPALNRALVPLSLMITNIAVEGDAAFAAMVNPWLDRPADATLIGLMEEYAASRFRTLRSVTVTLERQENFGGCTLRAAPFRQADEAKADKKGSAKMVGYSGLIAAPGVYGRLDKRLVGKPEQEMWDAFVTSMPDERRDFEKARKDVVGDRAPASSAAVVVFQTQWRTE